MTGADRCTRCRRTAVARQPYSGRALCAEHLVRDVESRAKRTLRQQAGLRHGERVGIAARGGAAGEALLAFAVRQFGARRDVTLLALAADEGIRVPEGVEAAAFRDRDPAAEARRLGCGLLMVPTTLEERAAEVLGAVLSGRSVALVATVSAGGLRVVRPFEHVPAAEVRLYLEAVTGAPAAKEPETTPGTFDALVTSELARHTRAHPSAPFALVRLADALAVLAAGEEERC